MYALVFQVLLDNAWLFSIRHQPARNGLRWADYDEVTVLLSGK